MSKSSCFFWFKILFLAVAVLLHVKDGSVVYAASYTIDDQTPVPAQSITITGSGLTSNHTYYLLLDK